MKLEHAIAWMAAGTLLAGAIGAPVLAAPMHDARRARSPTPAALPAPVRPRPQPLVERAFGPGLVTAVVSERELKLASR